MIEITPEVSMSNMQWSGVTTRSPGELGVYGLKSRLMNEDSQGFQPGCMVREHDELYERL